MSDIYVTHRGDRVTTSRHAIRYIDMRSENSFMFEAALSGFFRFPVKQLQLSFAALSPWKREHGRESHVPQPHLRAYLNDAWRRLGMKQVQ